MTLVQLDTDILSELIKLRNPQVLQHALTYVQKCGPLALSAITRYEIVRGYKQNQATTQLARFMIFCGNVLLLPVTESVLDRAADLWAFARRNGHPHGDADLIIAATALENGRALVTGNTPHFAWVPGLTIADWRQP